MHIHMEQAHDHNPDATSALAAETRARRYPSLDDFNDDRPMLLLLTRGQVRYLKLNARVEAMAAFELDLPCQTDYTLDLEHAIARQLADAMAEEVSTADLDEPRLA